MTSPGTPTTGTTAPTSAPAEDDASGGATRPAPAPPAPAPSAPAASAPRTARERARAELTAAIKERALAQLAEGGGAALSLRAVAREMGMASSALFRYFPNRDALLTALIVDTYDRLGVAAESAAAAVEGEPVGERWAAICHGVRDWALAHPHEYALIFGSPIPGYVAPQDTVGPASRVPVLLTGLLTELLATGAHHPDDAPPLPDDVVAAIAPVVGMLPPGAPPDLMVRGLIAWTYLFGAVSFEVFGHRHGVVGDAAAFFDHEVRRIATLLEIADPGTHGSGT
ncbi:TetR/AcrR family transcriptional regulator [Actinotalea sp. AC32]|nr:TetR/AcrR family transcriptional regulator [Actinotalea sp. AC32]